MKKGKNQEVRIHGHKAVTGTYSAVWGTQSVACDNRTRCQMGTDFVSDKNVIAVLSA